MLVLLLAPHPGTPAAPSSSVPRLCALPTYQRRRPEDSALYRMCKHISTRSSRAPPGRRGGLPPFVTRELRAYLRCGLLEHGCVHVRCERCGDDMVVAFSCKGRGFCPSCGGRRMTELAAHLVDHVIPDVPVRQWVLSLPWSLRYQLAFDAALCRDVLAVFIRVVFGWLARRPPARESPTPSAAPSRPSSASGTAVHTATSCTNKASIGHLRTVQGASQRSREALEPRGGVLGDFQPPHLTVHLEIVALPAHQPALDPRPHDVQPHAKALGRSRYGVASIRVTVGQERRAAADRARRGRSALSSGSTGPPTWSTGDLAPSASLPR